MFVYSCVLECLHFHLPKKEKKMRVRNWSSKLFKVVGAVLVVCTITVGAQLASGHPQPLSVDQLQAVTGGGDCEKCKSDENYCKEANVTTCTASGQTQGKYIKRAWTGQDQVTVLTGQDSGVVDKEATTPESCYTQWSNCDKQNGSCINCNTTSTGLTVNSICHNADGTTCPGS